MKHAAAAQRRNRRGSTRGGVAAAAVVLACAGFAFAPAMARHANRPLDPFESQPEPAPAQTPETPQPEAPKPEPASLPMPPDEPQDLTDGREREAVVTLRDGQRFSGVLVERTAEQIVLRISGIEMPIKMSMVGHVSIQPPITELYRQIRSSIDDRDVDRLLLLVEWLRARNQWNLALFEVDHILEIQPESVEAARLKLLVKSQKTLAERSRPATPGERPERQPDPVRPEPVRVAAEVPLLSSRDINLIKVYEIDLSDPPRMIIERDTIKRLIEEHSNDPLIPGTVAGRDALYRMSPSRILDLMFRVQARNLYQEVKVVDHPRSMKVFRDEVHRSLIINSCGTVRCHGGTEAGRLQFATRMPNTEPVVYTNFLILDRFKLRDGTPLINYDQPAKSPLLQLGLPREISLFKHPSAPGVEARGDLWRPFFTSTDDRRFTEAVEWIKSLYRPRPEYPIVYDVAEPKPPGPPEPPVIR